MMPVPSYQLVPFLAWLQQRQIRLSQPRLEIEGLRQLAREFLRRGGVSSVGSPSNLTQLLLIFQNCPMIDDSTVSAQMEHFSGCGRCLDMMHRSESAPIGRRLPNMPRAYADRGALPSELHPLLRGFVDWERSEDSDLDSRIQEVQPQLMPEREKLRNSREAFEQVIHHVGDQLREEFRRYLAAIQHREPDLIRSYEAWRRGEEQGLARDSPRRAGSRERDDGTLPIGANESLEQAAQRLADSVRLAIENGYYDARIEEEPQLARFMDLVMQSPEHLGQALEFLNWLRHREPELRVPGSIPSNEIEELALQFCEEREYSNGKSFSKETRRWLSGSGPESILNRIARFLGISRRPRLPNGQPAPHNLLDRYGAVRFHGLFLFLSSGNFPAFIETHWRDLHHLTGDSLDVYYSQTDLRDRTSGYEVAAQMRSLQIRVEALPAVVLWEQQLEGAVAVPLQGLDHDEIVVVMKAIVQAIRDDCNLNQAAERGAVRASELRSTTEHSILVESGAALLINHGGVMGDVYKNEGVVGAMGPNATAYDNVFLQDARKVLSDITLAAGDATVVTALAEALASRQVEGLGFSERMEGAKQLAALAEAAKGGHAQDQPLGAWKKWLTSLGARAAPVLAFLANVTTIAAPIAKLLGLPV